MTRKDYMLIAAAIKETHDAMADRPAERGGVYNTAATIACALRKDNPRFDAARFMDACGYVFG